MHSDTTSIKHFKIGIIKTFSLQILILLSKFGQLVQFFYQFHEIRYEILRTEVFKSDLFVILRYEYGQ